MANRILASLLKPTNGWHPKKWKEQLVYIDMLEELTFEERTITSSSPGYHINKMFKIANELKVDYLIYLRKEVSNEFEMKYFWALHKQSQGNNFNGCIINQNEFQGNTAKELFEEWSIGKLNPEWLEEHEAKFKKLPKLDWESWNSKENVEGQLSPSDKQTIKLYGKTYFEECLEARNKQIEAIYENARRELLLKPGEVLVMVNNNFYQFETIKDYKLAKYGNNPPTGEISLDELANETKKKRKRKPIKSFPQWLKKVLNSINHSQYSLTVGNEESYQRTIEMIKNPKDKWDWEWINNVGINRDETIRQEKIVFKEGYIPQNILKY